LRARTAATLGRLGRLVERARAAVWEWIAPPRERTRQTDSATETGTAGQSPRQSAPARQSARSSTTRTNRQSNAGADLVAERDEDTLTIRDPDSPEAHVESDTWLPVER
jgi:hypothetical protein